MKFSSPYLYGIGIVWACVLIGSMIASLLLAFTNMTETALPYFTYGINGVSLLAGGWIAGRKSDQKGWLAGGGIGLSYGLLILLIGFLAFDADMILHPLLFLCAVTGISSIGGILGVNSKNI
ncbi:TIGR04086 family membrane protein [Mechercharimyces sp. CAU 1602]|uniref:TIGR04086 family membrane protein n=1 Tax=Mechercharimyces sp. CAU 1602 TaxID=2973933 RepID=UPI0021624F08|nr:TIGR04086 family membrane protein [Mechercharimyces sp. CAU 1602]MCS1350680.1 TIGR04086 family membrane protein [Mechercharimyces sp. CAU 1602]